MGAFYGYFGNLFIDDSSLSSTGFSEPSAAQRPRPSPIIPTLYSVAPSLDPNSERIYTPLFSMTDKAFEWLEGFTGNDFLYAYGHTWTLSYLPVQFFGGSGNDTLILSYNSSGPTYVVGGFDGGTGNDLIIGTRLTLTDVANIESKGLSSPIPGLSREVMYGGDGNDAIIAGGSSDFGKHLIYGDAGTDYVEGGSGDDTIFGGDGDDLNTISFTAGTGGATYMGGLYGEDGNDYIDGGSGRDYIEGGNGEDYLRGGYDNDVIRGGSGADKLFGDEGNDRMFGDNGDDYARGGAGNDFIRGGNGNDKLLGDSGIDRVVGMGGNDFIRGGADKDILFGNDGFDRIFGDSGTDFLIGGLGRDLLKGGADRDRYVYYSVAESYGAQRDKIIGFEQGLDDIDLRKIDANTHIGGNQRFTFIGNDHFSHTAGELHYRQFSSFIRLEADVNGNGHADFHVDITGTAFLTAGDIFL